MNLLINSRNPVITNQGANDDGLLWQHRVVRMDRTNIHRLTDRQKDCLRLVADGYTSKEIGRKLGLSPSTVDNHILAATQLLGAMNRAEAGRILTSSEVRQKMPRETLALAETTISRFPSGPAEIPVLSIFGRRIWSLPPIGGHRNDLDGSTRTIRILQVSVVGFGTVISLALLIAGAFRLFS
jgi:DNA-binding CsgD family transcriptional regulator